MTFWLDRFKKDDEDDIWEELKQMLANPPSEQEIALKKQKEQEWIDSILNKAFPDEPKIKEEPYLTPEELGWVAPIQKTAQSISTNNLNSRPLTQRIQNKRLDFSENITPQLNLSKDMNLSLPNNNLLQGFGDIKKTKYGPENLNNTNKISLVSTPQQKSNTNPPSSMKYNTKINNSLKEPLKSTIVKNEIYTPYNEKIDKNQDWTEKEKQAKKLEVYNIHQQAKEREKEINRDHVINQTKIIGKEILPYAIPEALPVKVVTKTTKAFEPIVGKTLPKVGNKIKNKLSENLAKTTITSPINSSIEAIDEKENLTKKVLENYPEDITGSVLFSSYRANLDKKNATKNIKNKIANWNTRQQRKLQDRKEQYYNDYIKGTSEDIGIEEWLEELLRKRKNKKGAI